MLLWFAILAPVIVAEVFRSPMVDYRFVAFGAVLPLVEVVFGRPLVLHTLLAPVVVLGLAMATTTGHRLRRRQLLGIPIGMFLHLVLDGTWTDTDRFWWPVFGTGFADERLPAFDRGLVVALVLELVAIGVGAWAVKRYGLDRDDLRQRFLHTGQLDRSVF